MTYLEMLMNALKTERPRAGGTRQSPYGSLPAYTPSPETRSLQAQLNRDQFGSVAGSPPPAPQSLDYSYPASMYTYPGQASYMDAGLPPANKPASGASNAGPFVPTPPQRPANMGAPLQLPGARPAEQVGDVSMPSQGLAGIQGYNPYAMGAGPNAEAFAAQFAGGDLSKLGARTMRDEDGNTWNDYYVR